MKTSLCRKPFAIFLLLSVVLFSLSGSVHYLFHAHGDRSSFATEPGWEERHGSGCSHWRAPSRLVVFEAHRFCCPLAAGAMDFGLPSEPVLLPFPAVEPGFSLPTAQWYHLQRSGMHTARAPPAGVTCQA